MLPSLAVTGGFHLDDTEEQLSLKERDWRDIVGGLLMVAFGLFVAIYAAEHYRLGTTTRMGPGWFPKHLGYLLAIVGALIALPAFFRKGDDEPFELAWRPLIWIVIGVVLFAATVNFLGLVPAIFLQIGASVLADTKLGIKGTLILAASTALAAYLIFVLALELNLQAFKNPFGE